jgi:ABC-type Fe3+/spermidine/putrescine transport system ATPase subunit
MPRIELKALSKRFGTVEALPPTTLAISAGECLCLFGPSGCGKTTLLRLVAGLETPSTGEVLFDEKQVSGDTFFVPPRERDVGMVFQDFALWPHMPVQRHLNFVLADTKLSKAQREVRTNELLDLCRLNDRRRARPSQLSGGEQQRVSIARALATAPSLLLLDEPFAHLDSDTRDRIIAEILRRKREEGVTILLATHNEADAELLADRTVRMG